MVSAYWVKISTVERCLKTWFSSAFSTSSLESETLSCTSPLEEILHVGQLGCEAFDLGRAARRSQPHPPLRRYPVPALPVRCPRR